MDGVVHGGDLLEPEEFEVTDENFSSAWEVRHEFYEVSEGAETAATRIRLHPVSWLRTPAQLPGALPPGERPARRR